MCSMPPSEVGVGIMASEVVGRMRSAFFDDEFGFGRSRKARYIWVVNRLGTFVGVIHRVKGIRHSIFIGKLQSEEKSTVSLSPVSTIPPWDITQSGNLSLPECISFRALSFSASGICNSAPLPSLRLANNMPLSSKHSLMAPMRYAGPSWCL